jgi:hypothetical protein
MPVFRLNPIIERLDDPSWEASSFKETCWILARDEADARRQLENVSLKMVDVNPDKKIAYSPWRHARVTDCVEDVAPVGTEERHCLDCERKSPLSAQNALAGPASCKECGETTPIAPP